MNTTQDIRYIENADTAILFIHGILGTPRYFDPFLPLVPDSWSVFNLQLKGHGGSVKDFSAASMEEWIRQADEITAKLLETHKNVIIAAHSMGTLFAIREAVTRPVTELFLLNTPLKIRIKAKMFKTPLSVLKKKKNSSDEYDSAVMNSYSIERDLHLWRYLGWVPRYLELFSEISNTKKLIHNLKTPGSVFLSADDEMVSLKSGELFKENPCVTVKILKESSHFCYSENDMNILKDDFCNMVKRYDSSK